MSAEAGEQQQQGGPVIVVPPGFRFHPTDEELLHYYLRKKVSYEASFDLDVIREVDLNKLEPWDLRDKCRIGSGPLDQNEWYFFSHKDKKYPTGTRTNRATNAGFWKATGRDKPIYLSNSNSKKIGMRKTLVFYTGRAPHGQKTDWIMHEYRLDDNDYDHDHDHDHHHDHHHRISNNNTPHQLQVVQEDGWVVCRVFKKKSCHNGDGSRFFEPTDQAVATAREGGGEEEEGRGDYPHNPYMKPSGLEGASSFIDAKSKVHNNVHAHAAAAAAAASLLYESSNCMHLPQLWSPESVATAFNTSSMSSSSSISSSFLCSPIMSSNLAADFQLQQNFLRPAGLLTSSYDINSSGGGCGGGDWSFLDKLLHASHMQNPQEEDHIITKFNHPHATHHHRAAPNSPSAGTHTQRSYHPFQYLGCQPDTLKFSK